MDTHRLINVDQQWKEISDASDFTGGAVQRYTEYGDEPGLVAFGAAYPDKLVQRLDYKEEIAWAHSRQTFPLYHQRNTWAPPGYRWNQKFLNYCWAWSVVGSLKDLFAREDKFVPDLAPTTLGGDVGWRNKGNYLGSTLRWLRDRGVAERRFVPGWWDIDPSKFKPGWQDNALKYRLGETWDLDNSSRSVMIQHCVSVLRTGTPVYIAYNWWSHALELVALEWDEGQKNDLVWVIRNSHDEDDVIRLTGDKGVPDEAYGLRSSLTLTT